MNVSPNSKFQIPNSKQAKSIAYIGFLLLCVLLGFPRSSHAGFLINRPVYIGLTEGLVGYWSFDGPDTPQSTNNIWALDRSGQGNNGVLKNMATSTARAAGKIGQALEFDGVGDNVLVPNSSSLDISGNQIGISLWIKPQDTGAADQVIIGKFRQEASMASPAYQYGIEIDSSGTDGFQFVLDGSDFFIGPKAKYNQWQHVVFTHTGASVNEYRDGELVASEATTTSMIAYGKSLRIGIDANIAQGTKSIIDEVRIYNRALSAQDAKRLYNMGGTLKVNVTRKDTLKEGLVGHWTFDGPDMAKSTNYMLALDRSAQNNTGYVINATSTALIAGKIGQALQFDGVNDYVDIPKVRAFNTFASGCSGTTCVTPATPVTDGKDLVAVCQGYHVGGPSATPVISDGTNTWSSADITMTSEGSGDSNIRLAIFHARNITGGSRAVTCTWEASQAAGSLVVSEFSGVDTSQADGTGASATGSGTAPSSGNITTSGSSDLIVSGLLMVASGAGHTITAGSGYTIPKDGVDTSGSGIHTPGGMEYILNKAAGTYAGTWTIDSQPWGAAVFAYQQGTSLVDVNSVSFWMKANSATQNILTLSGAANVSDSSGTITATDFTSPTIYVDGVVSSVVNDRNWHHVVITTGTAITASTTKLGVIGSTYFSGSLDDVRMYNRVLSDFEIKRLYNMGGTLKANVTRKDVLKEGLVGHWTFDGPDMSQGTNNTWAIDRSGQGNNGRLANTATSSVRAAGKIGQALNFDSVDDWVNAGSASSLDNLTQKTACAWIYPTGLGGNTEGNVITKMVDATSVGWFMGIKTTATPLHFIFEQGWTVKGSWRTNANTLALNTWQHICATYDGSSTLNDPLLYINGLSQTVTEVGAPSGTFDDGPNNDLIIGAMVGTTNQRFKGPIDEVRVYNRALSADEVKRLYNMGR